jgi:hypothetical protein
VTSLARIGVTHRSPFPAAMEDDSMREAMAYDGVIPESLMILVEAI